MRRLPNLDQLRAFALAARRMSFSRAADELHLTPTAISHRIRALEAELCRPLFRRKVRGVDMDDRAAAYADRLNAAFDEIAAATEDLLAAGMSGTLRINAAPYFGNRVLLPMLSKINATWPDLFIDLSMSTEIVDLTSGEYDAAIRHGSGDWPGVSAIHIYTDTLRPVAAPQLVADRTLPLSPQDIAAFRLSTRPEAALDWDAWFRAAGAPETRPRELVGFSSQAASPDLALSGLGVALAGCRITEDDVRAGRLVWLSPVTIRSPKSMYLVFPETAHPDPRLVAVAGLIRDELVD